MLAPTFLAAALVGQYGAGYGHVNYAHQTYGHCYNNHAVAIFQADPAHYTAVVAQYVRAQATAAAAAQAQLDLTGKLDRLAGTVQALDARIAAATAPPAVQTPAPVATPMPQPTPGAPPPPAPSTVSPVAILERNRCSRCHTGSGSSGGFVIFESPGKLAPLDEGSRTAILKEMMSGRMPPKKEGVEVSLADKRDLLNLFLAGDAAK